MRKLETTELKQMLDRDEEVVLINALDTETFESGHIPGSHNVPSSDPDATHRIEQLAGRKDRPVVVYCSNPRCNASPKLGQELERAGFSNVLHYAGGMEEWEAAGHSVAQGLPR